MLKMSAALLKMSSLLAASCLALLTSTAAWAQEPVPTVPPTEPVQATDATVRSAYLLGSHDVLLIRVADAPEIGAQPVRIDPAGDIRLPLVGTVRAAGRTIDDLEKELITRLKVVINEPDLSVSVTEFHSEPVSVIGAVGQSGVHQLQGAKTLIEILSRAGGIRADAGPTLKITRRREWGRIPLTDAVDDASGGFSTVEIDLKALLTASIPQRNIMVRPHDVISIPQADTVFVIGEVGRPGPVALGGSSVSVMEAVSASGGVLRSASAGDARILRKQVGTETRSEVEVDLKKIMQGREKDVRLLAGDILVVPHGSGRRALLRALELTVQAGISIGTWGLVR